MLLVATIAMAVGLTGWWIVGAWAAESTCCGVSPEWLVIAISGMAVLNVAVLLGLLILRPSRRWLALVALEAANAVFPLAASLATTPAWLLYYAAPAIAIQVLVITVLRGRTSRKPAA